jgi:hypothetical protein
VKVFIEPGGQSHWLIPAEGESHERSKRQRDDQHHHLGHTMRDSLKNAMEANVVGDLVAAPGDSTSVHQPSLAIVLDVPQPRLFEPRVPRSISYAIIDHSIGAKERSLLEIQRPPAPEISRAPISAVLDATPGAHMTNVTTRAKGKGRSLQTYSPFLGFAKGVFGVGFFLLCIAWTR